MNSGSSTGLLLGNTTAAPWGEAELTLRVQNNTGSTVSSWGFNTDAWYGDPDTNKAVFTISYSTDGTTFTTLASSTTSRTTTETFSALNPAHWSANQNLGGEFSASVADGGYLYVRMLNANVGNSSGATFVLDNLAVSALIPEPATWVMVLGGTGVLAFWQRGCRRV